MNNWRENRGVILPSPQGEGTADAASAVDEVL